MKTMPSLTALKNDLRKCSDPDRAKILARFFKTGPGEYAEGDVFLGITVPQTRKIAKIYKNLSLNETTKLLKSKIHEHRLAALLILTEKFNKGNETDQKRIVDTYLEHTKYVNNWDLVDLSAEKILGEFLVNRPKSILTRLANSKNLWERRISIISTYAFIKKGQSQETLRIAKILLKDQHHLIHKAVGWMLREVGKRCSAKIEENFLKKHYQKMPRTMLRYAIEHFPQKTRGKYLK